MEQRSSPAAPPAPDSAAGASLVTPRTFRRLTVFCGSASGSRPEFAEAASKLGALLAAHRIALVFGGGRVGLMGILADAVLAAGGEAIGVMPAALVEKEIAHRGLTGFHVTATMHDRKARMADLGDAFLALPGGYGTLDELCEVLTWGQLGIHQKPVGLLNVCGFWDDFLRLLDHQVREGLLRPAHRAMLASGVDPAGLLERMRTAAWPQESKLGAPP